MCRRNDFADAIEATEPKFAKWMRKHGKIAVLKDDEVERLERASQASNGASREEVMSSMYGRSDPKPLPPSYSPEDLKYFNRSATTAAFSKSVENLVPHKKKDTKTKHTPGPGAYDYENSFSVLLPQSSLATKSSISAFKSSTKRFGSKSNDGASVGQYTLPDSFKVKERKYTTFKSSTGRYSSPEKQQQGMNDAMATPLPDKDPQKAALRVQIDQAIGIPGPGPGTYEVGVEDIDTGAKTKFGKYSSIFGKTTTDRFGKPVQPKVDRSISPGPGQYSHATHMLSKKGANSAFISSTDRSASSGIYQLGVAPGPCKYNPGRVDRKTFHLNTKKRWM